ncbi:hypothetical protein VKT23_008481 [Stygiomarasmius scandens]|uniref:Uncharacterized protein n=1 Tax=Marasmiellus scandens TaxID=2682957 RepID=A0ABR1JHE5_9AGAR
MIVNFSYVKWCRVTALVQLYLIRSQSVPLSLDLEAYDKTSDLYANMDPDPEHDVLREAYSLSIFRLFLENQERWQHIRLDLSSPRFGGVLLQHVSHAEPSHPLLKSLELEWDARGIDYFRTESDTLWLSSLVENAPCLQKLAFVNFRHEMITQIPFRTAQVTSVCMGASTGGFGVITSRIFESFSHLEHLDIDFHHLGPVEETPVKKHSKTLKSLTIRVSSLYEAPHTLSSLCLPALTDLKLSFIQMRRWDTERHVREESLRCLKRMLQQSLCRLQTLNIENSPSASAALLPHLEDLEILIRFDGMNIDKFIPDMNLMFAMVESRRFLSPSTMASVTDMGSGFEGTEDGLISQLSNLTVIIPSFKVSSERIWAEKFRAMSQERLQIHRDNGFTCTVNLGFA